MSKQDGKIFVKPTNPKVMVRNPERGGHLNSDGEYVPKNAYWQRRINDGDIAEAKPSTKKSIKE
ncbi:MAG: DUF2635 domain-containing protein [Cycloclasticus sp.]